MDGRRRSDLEFLSMAWPVEKWLDTARRAARAGAGALEPFWKARAELATSQKSLHDFVTSADVAAERAIAAVIRQTHPDHGILAEEELRADLAGPNPTWIIDPLDGTTNFIHGFPVFSVSVACAVGGVPQAGVVLDPQRREEFGAARGQGAWLNGETIRVSGRPGLAGGLIGTGFPFRFLEHLDAYLESFKAVVEVTAGIRRPGSAALDLAAVACGRFDGFWEAGLGPWDMAAGALLIEEAGGIVTDIAGGKGFLGQGTIVAGSPAVHPELLALVSPHFR